MTRVYLHIGANKTGTTALQHVLARSDGALRSEGILYPKAGRGRPEAGDESHLALASALGFDPVRRHLPDAGELIETLSTEIAASGCPEVVLSSEFFMLRRDIAPVASFLDRYDAHIVVFFRHHAAWLPSLVKQAILTVDDLPWDMTVRGYIAHQDRAKGQYIDYAELLDDWSAEFGKEKIIVRAYEPRADAPDIVASFFDAIGRAEVGGKLGPAPFLNVSLPDDALALIRQIRRVPLPGAARSGMVRAVERGARGGRGTVPMTSDLLAEIDRRFDPQYAKIATEYLGRTDGVLFSAVDNTPNTGKLRHSTFRRVGYILRGAALLVMDAVSAGRLRLP